MPDEQKDLMKILEKFSRGINVAIDNFKDEVLQIKVEEDKGFFDYRITSDDMCYATVSCNWQAKTYDEFCMFLMEYLLKMTNPDI